MVSFFRKRSRSPENALRIHRVLGTKFKDTIFPANYEKVAISAGCFWGTEKVFWRLPGVYSTAAIYTGGNTPNPTAKQVKSGKTGHAEAVLVVYNPNKISFADIMRMFLQCHDPTQKNAQGKDKGTQYRSSIFYSTEEQKIIAQAAINLFQTKLSNKNIQTEVVPLANIYYAEDEHQQYLSIPGSRNYCGAQPLGIQLDPAETWLPDNLQKRFESKFSEDFWIKNEPASKPISRQPHAQMRYSPR